MLTKKHHPFITFCTIVIFTVSLLFEGNTLIDISIKNATPLIAIPLVAGYSIFASINRSAVAGIIAGAMLDSFSSGSYCFNTICFLLIGVLTSLAANNLFNKNIRAAIALAVIISALYFIARWLVFMAFGVGIVNSLAYLLSYALPSSLYSAAFIFPYFYIFRYLSGKTQ